MTEMMSTGTDHDAAMPWDEPSRLEFYGIAPDEHAPRRPGRPAIGGAVHVRLGDLAEAVDRWAAENHLSRAEAVRQLVQRALDLDHNR